ncbi:60S ribosomal protein L5 [Tieghemostelium lacteum]|uniref:60S ribosomal protein L5 n=1 Tax=Tieghemostelium lacteum TaxID=361077 RepID=A0A151ZAN1_TIELA|nr:60S ribosomal protein L5 [Tieghemostelium lacteum]|eukprot:KYQ90954.1 60S ribosomal protein L5 [Tieghemostelium lacteum]
MVRLMPKNTKMAPVTVFVFSMLYLSVSHWYRMYVDYKGWALDYTGPQMVLTLKLTSFAWNLYDGTRPVSELDADQKRRAISKIPSLLEYYGFVYFFPTFLAGPTIEISDYLGWTSLAMFSDVKKQDLSSNGMPRSGSASLWVMIKAFSCFPLVILSGIHNVPYLICSEYQLQPIWVRLVLLHIHIALTRFKYYFAWFLSEGSAILSGIGYNGYDKEGKKIQWNRITNAEPLVVEFASNIRDISSRWNIGTGDWLKRYVYLRLTPPGAKPTFTATLLTYATSAFWHGFYPGYYFFFVNATFLTEIAKDFRRKLRPLFYKNANTKEETPIQPFKFLYDVIGWAIVEWFLSFLGFSFLSLTLEDTLALWKSYHYIPMVILYSTFIIFRYIIPAPKQKRN